MNKYVLAFDIECDKTQKIIAIGSCILDCNGNEIERFYHHCVRSDLSKIVISNFWVDNMDILDEMSKDNENFLPTEKKILSKFHNWIEEQRRKYDCYVVSDNIAYDVYLINKKWSNTYLDNFVFPWNFSELIPKWDKVYETKSMRMALKIVLSKDEFNHLNEEYNKIKQGKKAHYAIDDSRVIAQEFILYMNLKNNNI